MSLISNLHHKLIRAFWCRIFFNKMNSRTQAFKRYYINLLVLVA